MTHIEKIKPEKIADTAYEICSILKQRYSPRIFKKDKIKDEDLSKLFEAARWAPSSNNLQPWRFIYAEKGTDAYQSIYESLSDFNKSWANNAPLLMLSAYKEKDTNGNVNFHALHDLGLSLGFMGVQAQHMDIGLHHMAGVDWKKAQKDFNVPDGYHVTTAIAIGYYGGSLEHLSEDLQQKEIEQRKRMPYKEFAFKEGWKIPEN